MEARLSPQRPSGLDRNKLRLLGLIIAAFGMLGRGILQNRVLGMGTVTSQQLLELMQASGAAMNAATVAMLRTVASTLSEPWLMI